MFFAKGRGEKNTSCHGPLPTSRTLSKRALLRQRLSQDSGAVQILLPSVCDAAQACRTDRLDYLKEEKKLIATLNIQQVKRIVDWKPVEFCGKRLQTLCCLLLDTGLRFEKGSGAPVRNFDGVAT